MGQTIVLHVRNPRGLSEKKARSLDHVARQLLDHVHHMAANIFKSVRVSETRTDVGDWP